MIDGPPFIPRLRTCPHPRPRRVPRLRRAAPKSLRQAVAQGAAPVHSRARTELPGGPEPEHPSHLKILLEIGAVLALGAPRFLRDFCKCDAWSGRSHPGGLRRKALHGACERRCGGASRPARPSSTARPRLVRQTDRTGPVTRHAAGQRARTRAAVSTHLHDALSVEFAPPSPSTSDLASFAFGARRQPGHREHDGRRRREKMGESGRRRRGRADSTLRASAARWAGRRGGGASRWSSCSSASRWAAGRPGRRGRGGRRSGHSAPRRGPCRTSGPRGS